MMHKLGNKLKTKKEVDFSVWWKSWVKTMICWFFSFCLFSFSSDSELSQCSRMQVSFKITWVICVQMRTCLFLTNQIVPLIACSSTCLIACLSLVVLCDCTVPQSHVESVASQNGDICTFDSTRPGEDSMTSHVCCAEVQDKSLMQLEASFRC